MASETQLIETLKQYFGYESFRGQQASIIDRTISGNHSLVLMPTGMGKSLCYQVPGILLGDSQETVDVDRPALTLVISPLISLMKDQVDALNARNLDATFVNSSLDRRERNARYEAIATGRYRFLYVTPERFRKPEFLEALKNRTIVLFAVDEAHCISHWGHDFRPDYTRVGEIAGEIQAQQNHSFPIIALTATATPDVQRDIVKQLNLTMQDMKIFHHGIDRPNLSIDVRDVWDDDEKLQLILDAIQEYSGSQIVYFTLIKTLERFSDRLRAIGLKHQCYHGDLTASQRRRVQDQFMNRDDQLVLATNAFGMGIDKEDIRLVIHADLPGSVESYYQEIGRAGRDGQPSKCLLLYSQDDLATQMQFIQWSNPDANYYHELYRVLNEEAEKVNSYGFDYLMDRLHFKQKHDRRIDTALSMLFRWEVIEGDLHPFHLEVVSELPPEITSGKWTSEKEKSDQQKLFSMMQFAKLPEDHKEFLDQYFGCAE